MNPWAVLTALHALGATLTVEGERLRVQVAAPVPVALRAGLVACKPDLMAYLGDSWRPGVPLPWPEVTLAPGLLYYFAGPGGCWTIKRDGSLYAWRRLRGVLEPGGLASGFLVTFTAWLDQAYRGEGDYEQQPTRSAFSTAA